MSTSVSRPPAETPLAELFTTWLPDAFARAVAAGAKPRDAVVSIDLAGDGGGTWTVKVEGGALTVTDAADATAHLAVRMTDADFRALVWGEGDIAPIVPERVDLAGALTGTRLPTADLAQVKGALRVEVPGFAGRTWAVTVVLGGTDQPAATVSADLPTLAALRDGSLPPAQALFGGKIAMTGDVAWLMQVGMNLAGSGLGGPR